MMVGQIHFLRVLIFVPQTHRILLYLGMNGEYISLRVSLVHWRLYCYVQHLAGTFAPIFPKPRGYPCAHVFHCSSNQNIFDSTTIKLKWRTVKHLFKFYMELDGISSTSFQVFDCADLKGKRQRNLKPFYFAWLNLRLPPRLHVTRARPYQGGSWECWGPPWISTFETWNTTENIFILYSYIQTYIQIHLC